MNRKRLALINIVVCFCFICPAIGGAHDGTLDRIKDETLAYFKPLKGRVISVEGDIIISDLSKGSGIRKGMRLDVLREGVPLLHPVTKEQIGRVETPLGRAEVIEVSSDRSRLKIINGEPKEGDILRLSERKVRALFYQDRSVPWEVGEALYQKLKESGRFDLVDSTLPLDSSADKAILEDARKKKASIIIAITSIQSGKETALRERIIWAEDGANMMQTEENIDASLMKESQFSDLLSIGLGSKEALLFFDLPYSGRLITIGNFDGKDKNEIVISNGKVLRIYTPGISLLEIYEIDVPVAKEHLYLDKVDINSDGKDEIVLTTLGDNEVISYIFEKGEGGFNVLWKDKTFLRVVDGRLIAQSYSEEGYTGPVYSIDYRDGRFIRGENLKLPSGVNIYDFAYITEGGSRYILSYDDKGYLSLYDVNGLRLWMSKEDSGGFINTFKRAAPTIMVDRGEWSVKDKLFSFGNKTIFIKRIPLADMARTLGFKRSEIRVLWWTGLSMEEMTIVDGISGGVMDYAVSGDRIYVISKPLFGIKAKNILKGENPLGSMLYVYSLKGF
ncbi:MAG: hypothetical protein ACK415_04885 [Thermodesulfovibrionales bacterium]